VGTNGILKRKFLSKNAHRTKSGCATTPLPCCPCWWKSKVGRTATLPAAVVMYL
jgi:hypothetical protein